MQSYWRTKRGCEDLDFSRFTTAEVTETSAQLGAGSQREVNCQLTPPPFIKIIC